jgi:hypothetical protein
MAKVFGKPSPYLREKSLHHLYKSVLMALGGFAIALILLQAQSSYPNKTIGFLITYTLIVILAVLSYRFYKEDDTTSDNYFRGRKGESIILEELKKLPDTFRVFCDVKIQHPYNIDFLVAGPTGIFTVEVKSHSGKIGYENGRITINSLVPKEKDFLRQAKGEAGSVAEYLKEKTGVDYWVSPVLVFSSPSVAMHFGLKPVGDVFVVGRGFLQELIRSSRGQQYSEATLLELESTLAQLT